MKIKLYLQNIRKIVALTTLTLPIYCCSPNIQKYYEEDYTKQEISILETKLEDKPIKLQGYFTEEEKQDINKVLNLVYTKFPKAKEKLNLIIQKNFFKEKRDQFWVYYTHGTALNNIDSRILDLSMQENKLPLFYEKSEDPKIGKENWKKALEERMLKNKNTFQAEKLIFRKGNDDVILIKEKELIEYQRADLKDITLNKYYEERPRKVIDDCFYGVFIHEIGHILIDKNEETKEEVIKSFRELNHPIEEKLVNLFKDKNIITDCYDEQFNFVSKYSLEMSVKESRNLRCKYEDNEIRILFEPWLIEENILEKGEEYAEKKCKSIIEAELNRRRIKGQIEDSAETFVYLLTNQKYADNNLNVIEKVKIVKRALENEYK